MKNSIKTILLSLAFIALSTVTMAQEAKRPQKSKEEVAQYAAKKIAQELALDEQTSARFVSLYCKQQREIRDTAPKKALFNSKKDLTDEEAEAVIMQRFDHSQKILDIRRKYYPEFCKFLTKRQVLKFYQQEWLNQRGAKAYKGGKGHKKHGKAPR